jgi:hypothetical protein
MAGAAVLAGASVAAQDRLKAVNDVRTTLLQAVDGMVLLFGAYATWRQLRATQEGYVTDRFSTAVDQLGSDKLETRIGGLHALWRIAEHSARDCEAVISNEVAYLRTHLPWPPAGPQVPAADVPINLKTATLRRDRCVLADLRLADPRGADLTAADLLQVRLTGAVASENTRWPAGLDHATAGLIVTEDPEPERPPLLQPTGITTQHPPLRSVP